MYSSNGTKRILTKEEYYRLYENGLFGNKALTWSSFDEVLKSGWKRNVCIRSRKPIARNRVRYNISLKDIPQHIKDFEILGVPENDLAYNESMPDEKLLLQGEVMIHTDGMHLLYTTLKKPMNQALSEESQKAKGLEAKILLKNCMYPSSLSDLMSIFEMFPDSAVEFSSYSISIGCIPGRNTIIWEVRNY